jgi:hypothetical protein
VKNIYALNLNLENSWKERTLEAEEDKRSIQVDEKYSDCVDVAYTEFRVVSFSFDSGGQYGFKTIGNLLSNYRAASGENGWTSDGQEVKP